MRKGGEKTHGGGALVGGGSSGGHKRNNSQLCSSSPTLSSASSSSSPRLSHQGPSSLSATLSLSSPVTSASTAAATSTATNSTPIAPAAPSPLASSSSSASNNTSSASSTTSSTTPPSTPPPSPNHSNQSKRRSTSPGLRREKRHSRRPSSVTLAALTQQLSHQQQQQQGEFNNTPSAGSGGGPEQQPVFLDYYLAEYPHVFVAFLLLLSILVLYLPRVALICILLCALFIVLYNNSRQVRRKMQRNRRPIRHSRNNSRVVSPSLESATTKTSSRTSSSRSSSSPPSPLSSSRTTKRVTSKSNSRGKSNNISGTSSPSLSAGPSPALFSFQSGASSQLGGGDDAEDEPQFTYSYKKKKQHEVPEEEEEEEEDQLESRDGMAIVMDEEEEEVEGPEQGLKPDVLSSHLVGTKRDRRRTKEGKKEKKNKKEKTSARPSTTTQNPNFDQESAEDRGHFSDDELQTKRPRTQKRSGDRSSQLVMLHDFMESQRLSLDLISTALRDSSTDEENSPLKDLHLSSRPRSSSLSPRARERLHHPNSYQESAAPLPVTISGGSAPKTILSELQQQRIGGSFPARSHSTPGTVRIHPTPSPTATTTTSALSPSFYSSPAAASSVPAISSPLASSSSPNSSPVTSPTTSSASLSDTYGYCQGFLPFLLRRGYPLLLNTLNQFSPKCELDCSKRTQAKVMATGNYFKQYYSQLFDYLIARQQRQKATEKYIRKARLTVEEESYYRAEKAMKESMYLRLRRTRLKVQDFQVLSLLGRGGYGEVYLVRNRHTGEILALKRMKKAQFINKNEVPRVKREKEVMVKTQNIWMVKLKLSFQDSTYLYLGMEYCPGGDLRGLLNNLGRLSEDHARLYVAEMVLAVESLHQLGYIHRDLKPGNFLLDKKGHLKLIDFGLSKEGVMKNVRQSRRSSLRFESRRRSSRSRKSLTGDREWAYSLVGSPEYMAPEILEEKGYDETADWWSVGILMFEMVFGYTPFIAETVEEIFANISNWKQVLQFPDLSVVDETPISEAGIDFMKRMICEPDVRLGKNGAENIKSHRFFQGLSWKTIRDIVPPFVPRLTSEFDTTYFGEVEKFDGTKDIAELLEIEFGTQNREEEEEAEYEAENLEDQPHDAASSSSTNSPSTRHQETTLSDPSSTEEKNSNKNGGKTRRGSGNSTPQQGSPMVSPRGSPKQSSRSNGSTLNGEDTDSSTKGRPSSPSSHLEEQQTEEESASIKPLKDKRVDKVTKEFTPEMKRRRSTHFLNEDEQMFAGFTFTSFNEPPSDPSALFPNPLSFPRSGLAGARKVRKSLLKKTPMHHHAKAKEKKKEKEKEKEREKERTSMVVLPTTTEENEEEEEM